MSLHPGDGPDDASLFRRRGFLVLAAALVLFASLPFASAVWGAALDLHPLAFRVVVYVLLPAAVLGFLAFRVPVRRWKDPLFYAWSAAVLAAYVPLLLVVCEFPAERFHAVEYGALAALTYWWLGVRIRGPGIYLAVLALGMAVGTADEGIQALLPNRFGELKDLAVNWASSLLAAGLVAGATWGNHVREPALRRRVRRLGWIAVLLAGAGAGAFLWQGARKAPLNVVLLTVDSFRPDRLGSCGGETGLTPSMDELAGDGAVFSSVIASAPWTSPGLISLFTGLQPEVHGVTARGRSLLPDTPTLFRLFREQGYRVPNLSYLTAIQNFSNLGLGPAPGPVDPGEDDGPGRALLRWIEEETGDRPFLLWYHYRYLHLPYAPGETGPEATRPPPSEAIRRVMTETVIPRGSVSFSPEERRAVRSLYDRQVRELDRFVRTLVETLEARGLLGNTLLAITADHGEELFDHGFIGHASTAVHATLYDEVLRIPLLLHAPSRIRAGVRVARPVRQVDVLPTLLELAGLPVPDGLHGVSLVPCIRGGSGAPASPALSESVLGGYQSTPEQLSVTLRSIRTREWKLICRQEPAGEPCRLFDLRNDPGEARDLARVLPERTARMRRELHARFAGLERERLDRIRGRKPAFDESSVPEGAVLTVPRILSPEPGAVIRPGPEGLQVRLAWTGDDRLTYVVEYDVGRGWRNLTGAIPIQGTRKSFGPLPREAWEPLPYWNPFRIRVAPYGLESYWSDWVTFRIAGLTAGPGPGRE